MLKGVVGRKTVYIITRYTDMRKGIDGLATIIQGKLSLCSFITLDNNIF